MRTTAPSPSFSRPIDVRFDAPLPPVYPVLRPGEEQKAIIEVLVPRAARHVPGFMLPFTPQVAAGVPGGLFIGNTKAKTTMGKG